MFVPGENIGGVCGSRLVFNNKAERLKVQDPSVKTAVRPCAWFEDSKQWLMVCNYRKWWITN
jgi:hypothetical protein